MDYVFGYTVHNDVSGRTLRTGASSSEGSSMTKGMDTFSPLGPFVTLKEDVPAPTAPLNAGDTVEITIERLGTLRNRVVGKFVKGS